METEVISVRVRKSLREKLSKSGIDLNEAIRKYLEDLAWKAESDAALDRLDKIIRTRVKPSKQGFSAKSVREDRDEGH